MRVTVVGVIAAIGCATPAPDRDAAAQDGSGTHDAVTVADALRADGPVVHDHVELDVSSDAPSDDADVADALSSDAALADAADVDVAPPVDAGPRTLRTLNGCDPTAPTTVDMTTSSNPMMLARVDFSFAPACIRVRAGQSVIFRVESPTDWRAHPLRAGEVVGVTVIDDPSSPIPFVNTGTADVTVRFDTDGSYGFYCTRHYTLGFVGAVHVVP